MSQLSLKWIFFLKDDFVIDLRRYLPPDYMKDMTFEDRKGKCWLKIAKDGQATIFAPYAWDGCTPKFGIWDIVFGTPDGVPNATTKMPKAYYASLVHDVLYQFLDSGLPMTRARADRIFLDILTRDNFAPRSVYFYAVRIFGGLFRLFTRWKREYRY